MINLSCVEIPDIIHNIMKLVMNTHLKTKSDSHTTKMEIEKLYRSMKSLETDKKIILPDEKRLKCKFKCAGLRSHYDFPQGLLNKEDFKAIEEFCFNNDIITRKVDKSSTVVVLQNEDYTNKLDELISDQQSFMRFLEIQQQ